MKWPRNAMMVLVCLAAGSCADDPPCGELSAADCDTGRCAAMSATRIDTDGMCLAAHETVGCMEKRMLCTSPVFVVRDPSGGLWQFTDGCLPVGWHENTVSFAGQSYASQLPASWERQCP